MLTTNALKKLDNETQKKIFQAQIDELVERRGVQDAALFTHCFASVAHQKDGDGFVSWIDDFQSIAGEAFKAYHDFRQKGVFMDPNTGSLTFPAIPAAEPKQDGAEEPAEAEEAEDDEP